MNLTDLFWRRYEAGATLDELLADVAHHSPQAMLFLARDGSVRELSYALLQRQAGRIAQALIGRGLRRGVPVLLFFDDELELVRAFWSVLAAGAVPVPLTAPGSWHAADPALTKILSVARSCRTVDGESAWLLTDLPLQRLAQVEGIASAIDLPRCAAPAALHDEAPVAGEAPALPAGRADELALLMFSSGSTGDPKGVRLTHRQIICNLAQLAERSEMREDDRSLSWLPLTHDMGLVLFHILHTLAGLAQYKMTPLDFARDPARLMDHASAHRISVLGMPNFGFDQLCRAAAGVDAQRWDLTAIRLIYNGAEPIDPALTRRFVRLFGRFGLRPAVINPGWGIAEAAVAAAGFQHSLLGRWDGVPSLWVRGGAALTVGMPVQVCAPEGAGAIELAALGPVMRGMELRALDDAGQPLPEGHLGHLEMRGPNVTRGYYGVPDGDWCPTGDIGFVHDGLVVLTGRAKDVIFLNGRNHFSNDIEATLSRTLDWPANQLAVVGITDPVRRVEQVVVFFRHSRADGPMETVALRLRQALEAQLAYPIAAAIGLPALPKTTSGKIRRFELRQALLEGRHDAALHAETARPAAARALTPAEARVLALVQALLPQPTADADPTVPLSRYGLDSVGFMQLGFALVKAGSPDHGVVALIQAGSLERIVALMAQPASATAAARTPSATEVPLTDRQQMLWTAALLSTVSGPTAAEGAHEAYHEAYWLRLHGTLDAGRWLAAAREVLDCHPMLRAGVSDGLPPRLVLRPERPWDVAHECCASEEEARTRSRALAAQAFDLQHGPMIRLRLLQTPEGWWLSLATHHLVTDGWSLHLLLSQIFARYTGGELPAHEALLWHDAPGPEAACVSAWRDAAAAAQALVLPGASCTHVPGTVQALETVLPASLAERLRQWQRRQGSEFSAMAAALMTLLARLAGVDHPLLGTVASGRRDACDQSRVGYFAQTHALHAPVGGSTTFVDLVTTLEQQRLALLAGDVPDLARLQATPGAALAAEVRVVFVHQNLPQMKLPEGLSVQAQGAHRGRARADLTVSSQWRDNRLVLDWEYDSARLNPAQVEDVAELFEHVLAQCLDQPARPLAECTLLSPAQAAAWAAYQGEERTQDTAQDVVRRFEQQAHARAQQPALSDAFECIDYGELSRRVDALCWRLEEHGVGRGDRVALLTARRTDYVAALLAVLKLGAVAVPLDPALPRERIERILRASGSSLLLGSASTAADAEMLAAHPHLLFEGAALGIWPRHAGATRRASDAAYLIFTSGSTGEPKGVAIGHHSLDNLVAWVVGHFGYRPGETICQFAPFSFDVSMAEILPSLAAGLHVHVLADDRRAEPLAYLRTLREQQVAVATVTPAYLKVLNELPEACRENLVTLRLLILGGEALQTEEVRRWRAHSPHVEIVNVYGPTETTVMSSAYRVPQALSDGRTWQPLGTPIANTEFWVLDEAGRACPRGVTGSLHIGGAGLALGYWNDIARTDAAFTQRAPDGRQSRRFYNSGDLARLAWDGQLEFVGRADTQIKLRGFRIELGEIEVALQSHPAVDQAVVGAVSREGSERVLVAWWSGVDTDPATLASYLRERLPAYMVPATFTRVQEWPLSANRKVDRSKLPTPQWQTAAADFNAPRTPTESTLAELWCEVLGLPAVGIDDQFALLGGSSLAAATLVNRVRDRMGRELSLVDVLRHPRLATMAALIDAAPTSDVPILQRPRGAQANGLPVAASEAQARMVFLERTHAASAINNIPLTLRLGAAPDEAALEAAMAALQSRHEILRAAFAIGSGGVMMVPHSSPIVLERLEAADTASVRALLAAWHARPYDIERGPLWRVAVARAAGQHWLALSMHHGISDGVTLVRLLDELDALATGRPLPDAADEFQYSDFVQWQRSWLDSAAAQAAVDHWNDPAHLPPEPHLPGAMGAEDDARGRQFLFELDERQTRMLSAMARAQRVSPFVLMTSLMGFALGQRCHSQRMALGVTFSGRSRAVFERTPGLFVNTLPLAFDWDDKERLSELLARTAERLARLQALQDYPLNRVIAQRRLTQTPFNVLFNEEVLPADLRFAGAPAELERLAGDVAHMPLVISFLFGGPRWLARIEARERRCPPEWLAGLLDDLRHLIDLVDGMAEARLSELHAPDEQLMALLDLK